MLEQFDVCIRGGGVVGRTLALLLAQQGLRVALVAQGTAHPALSSSADVRAYALNCASRKLLESLRVWPEGPAVTPVTQMQVWDEHAAQLDFSTDTGPLAWIVDVPALEQALAQAVAYQTRITVVDAPAQAALTVVCEGRHSTTSAQWGVQSTTRPYQQRAVAARLESNQAHSGVARQWFAHGEVLALLPTGGLDAEGLALIWSVTCERAQALEALPAEEFCVALQAVCGLQPGQLRLSSERASWPLSWSTADHWVGPGWALAGDAAHTVHPLAGQGLNLGLADVAMLAQTLARRELWRTLGDERLLRRYERARKGDVAVTGGVSDALQAAFAYTDAPWQTLRDWGVKGFDRSGPLKSWVTRRAMGVA